MLRAVSRNKSHLPVLLDLTILFDPHEDIESFIEILGDQLLPTVINIHDRLLYRFINWEFNYKLPNVLKAFLGLAIHAHQVQKKFEIVRIIKEVFGMLRGFLLLDSCSIDNLLNSIVIERGLIEVGLNYKIHFVSDLEPFDR